MVFLMIITESGVFFCVVFGDFAGVVGGTVVDEYDFEVLVALGGDGGEAVVEVFCDVVNGDDEGDFGGLIFDWWVGDRGDAEDEAVVEAIVQDHGDGGGEAKNAGGFNEIVIER